MLFYTLLLSLVCLVTLTATVEVKIKFKEYVSPLNGYPMALVDFDANSYVDLVVTDSNFQKLSVYLIQKDAAPVTKELLKVNSGNIKSVIAADFNGDSITDFLLTVQESKTNHVYVAFGKENRKGIEEPKNMVRNITGQANLIDYNADMLGDFLVAVGNDYKVYTGIQKSQTFGISTIDFVKHTEEASTVFADFNGDLRADLLVVNNQNHYADIFLRTDKGFSGDSHVEVSKPPKGAFYGQPSVFELNDKLSLILPVCDTDPCSESFLFVYQLKNNNAGHWIEYTVKQFQDKSYNWFVDPVSKTMQIRPGDIDLDGKIDFLITVKGNDYQTVAMTSSGDKSNEYTLKSLAACPKDYSPQISAFADLDLDGALDLFIGCKKKKDYKIATFKQEWTEDGYFFKVNVLSGKCNGKSDCPESTLPVGLPVTGICVRFITELPTGGYRTGTGCQSTVTSYNSLQLPGLHFGLGAFSNYIDKLSVAIPYNSSELSKDFPFLIPNSQLVVVPHPNTQPSYWRSELFVRPFYDKQILYVGITLLVTCLAMSLVAAIFQAFEYRSDKQDRIKSQQGVVFDPMVGR